MTVWALQTDWSCDLTEHHSDVYLYATEELAKKSFAELVEQDKTESYADVYCGESGSNGWSWEEDDSYWCIYENGRYVENHSEIKITKQEVIDKDEYERLRGR